MGLLHLFENTFDRKRISANPNPNPNFNRSINPNPNSDLKGPLNPNFLNLTINKEKMWL